MSIALLGSIISYFLPFAQKVFGLWERKENAKIQREIDAADHARELELGRIQLDIAKAKGKAQVEAVDRKASASEFVEAQRSYRAEGKAGTSQYVNDIRGLVRPGATIAVVAILCYKEAFGLQISAHFAAISAVVIGFWFAGRDIMRMAGNGAGKALGAWKRLQRAQ